MGRAMRGLLVVLSCLCAAVCHAAAAEEPYAVNIYWTDVAPKVDGDAAADGDAKTEEGSKAATGAGTD